MTAVWIIAALVAGLTVGFVCGWYCSAVFMANAVGYDEFDDVGGN